MTETLYRLQMLAGPRVGQSMPLDGPRLTIGRYPLAEIVLDDPQVAYRHAVLTRAGDDWRLSDLNSDTGTTVNGQRVGAEPVALQPGDLIVLGTGVSMTFEVDAPAEAAALVEEALLEAGPEPLEEVAVAAADEYEASLDATEEAAIAGDVVEPEQTDLPPLAAGLARSAGDRAIPRGAAVYAAPPADPPRRNNRLWWTAAGCLALLFLCCCVFSFFMYFWGGDWLLRQLGYL